MDLEKLRNFCLSKKGVSEEFPFDEETLVYKVMGKMFFLTNIHLPLTVNLKCDPEKALELRDRYDEIQPGFHMNKRHWNTVNLDGSLNDKLILEMVEDSYNLVASGLTKKQRIELEKL